MNTTNNTTKILWGSSAKLWAADFTAGTLRLLGATKVEIVKKANGHFDIFYEGEIPDLEHEIRRRMSYRELQAFGLRKPYPKNGRATRKQMAQFLGITIEEIAKMPLEEFLDAEDATLEAL